MSKKSQITMFIIVVFILILGLMVVLYLSGDYTPDSDINTNLNLDAEATALTSYIENCIDIIAKETFYKFGMQGGSVDFHQPSLVFEVNNVTTNLSILYYGGDVYLVTLREWESRLSTGINNKLLDCLETEEIKHYSIDSSNPSTNVTADGNITRVTVDWPMIINLNTTSHKIDGPYSLTYEINLIHIYDDVLDIVALEKLNPNTIDFTSLVFLNTSIDFSVIDSIIIYTIFDPTSNLDNRPYQFNFANKFNHSWIPENGTA